MPDRAMCPTCQDFTVAPDLERCLVCGKPKDRRYDYVPVTGVRRIQDLKPGAQFRCACDKVTHQVKKGKGIKCKCGVEYYWREDGYFDVKDITEGAA